MGDEIYTVAQTAQYLKVCDKTVRNPHFIYVRTAWPSGCAVLFAVCVSLSCKRPRYVLPVPGSAVTPCGVQALPAH